MRQACTSFSLTRLLSVEAQNTIAKLRPQVQQHVLRLPVRMGSTGFTLRFHWGAEMGKTFRGHL
jgi:hypothetical protein